MILGRKAILERIASGDIHIKSDLPVRVNPNSVNVRLGKEMFTLDAHPSEVRNLHEKQRYAPVPTYTKETFLTESPYNVVADGFVDTLREGVEYFLLMPGTLYIGTTHEEIGTTVNSNLTTLMKARSTAGRLGFTVALCAGVGDIGYRSRWALEIRLPATSSPVVIAVGTEVGQIVFEAVEGADGEYTGHYQEGGVQFLPKPLLHADKDEEGTEVLPGLVIV